MLNARMTLKVFRYNESRLKIFLMLSNRFLEKDISSAFLVAVGEF